MRILAVVAGLMFIVMPARYCGAVAIENAFPMLSFTQPVDLQNAADGSNRLFVVERRGVIYVFDNHQAVPSKSVFLDIQSRVDDSGTEEGLLGLAFHPDYESNGYFYVDYTSSVSGLTHVSRFSVSATDSNVADPSSELVIIQIPKPYENHNAGQIAFGPADGYLYITAGDGGSAGDPNNNGQNRATLLGSILRIDVDSTETGLNYAIPPDNPFAGNSEGYREEIYAYGLRNPWRMSFDDLTGRLWAADVGQSSWEEVDIIESGGNYGWRIMEGAHCYNPPSGCDSTGLTGPIWEYNHSVGYAVTGGYVYRGCCVPELAGKYIYADYGSGRIWSLAYDGVSPTVNTELLDTALNITSFGVDEQGEIYICAFDDSIYRFAGTASIDPGGGHGRELGLGLGPNRPNPFRGPTTITFSLPERPEDRSRASLGIYDLQGRLVKNLLEHRPGPGVNSVSWDGTDSGGNRVAPGIYLYRLEIGNAEATRKMTLLK
jgi:glucose/arabinose dehydrogenase